MFAHARYSEKVFRNLPPNIAKGVERDIAYVLKKDNPNDVKKWNRVLPSQSDIDQTYRTPASRTSNELAIPRIRPQRYVKPKPADLRNEFVSARELLHKDYHSTAESFLPSRD
uniref:Testicular haploid expressed protein n=1 Tax=Panagrolaimus sp. ES5 TaxID=591445 RepID=A0AC34G2L8_9BILA